MKIFSDLFDSIYHKKKQIFITGKQLTFHDCISYLFGAKVILKLDQKSKERVIACYESLLDQTKKGVPIYGINAAYGAQANYILNATTINKRLTLSRLLSKSILHVDVSVGPPIPMEITRVAMLIRLNSLAKGYSGIAYKDLVLFNRFINTGLTPIVGQYGSLGASGDLAQNGRILSVLLHDPNSYVWNHKGETISASIALPDAKLKPIKFKPKNGLGFVNGDNFSTASAIILTIETALLMYLNIVVIALVIQALRGSNRSFHQMLGKVRGYEGQIYASDLILKLLKGSKLSIDELTQLKDRPKGQRIQDRYSLRCLSQFLGPDLEKINRSWNLLKTGINAVSDNPLFVSPEDIYKDEKPWTWISGGNFLGSYAADINDDLRRVLIRLIKLNDRHLATLIDSSENNGLPPNLSDPESTSNCAFKGVQNQMGMLEVYATALSNPVSTLFGVHEEGNQDITAHGLTSWIIAKQLIKLLKYSIASNLIAVSQAIDLRGGKSQLSHHTQYLYDFVRQYVPYIKTEQPMGHYIQTIFDNMESVEHLLKLIPDLA